MAAGTPILSLNLGSQTVGLAKFFAQSHGGLVLSGYRLREISPDAPTETARNAQISAVLEEMMSELYVKVGRVNYAIAAQSAFARFVKLPAVEEEKIERIIGFEAQQNVPFPIDEVVWDYQLIGGGPDEQIQVVIIAIKADYLEGLDAAIEESGLQTNKVGVATMSLYNAFRYNYSEITGCSLLVDLGARTTNLLFIEPGKIFWRSVAIGGGSLTLAIARDFGESFAAAESRKKRTGFVSLGGAYAEPPDPDVARTSKIIRSTLTRLHAEIMRSISHYRAQQEGSQPTRVFLCGGSASMPYMREFFHEKLQLPVEFFHPLRNVAVTESVNATNVSKSAHLLGELVGLALRTAASCPMELNLLPPSAVRAQKLEKQRPFFVMAAVCFILALVGWGLSYARGAGVMGRATQQLQQKIDVMRAGEAQFDKLHKQTASLDSVASPLITAINDRSFWPEILEDLNARLPAEGIWITELIPMSGGRPVGVEEKRVTELATSLGPGQISARPAAKGETTGTAIDMILVRGLYLFNPKQEQLVVDYFRNLAGSPFFIVDPNKQSEVVQPSVPTNTEWAFPYSLKLKLRKPLSLP